MVRPKPASFPPGSVIGGKYALGRRIGGGGMGSVFAAVGPDGREVAVKMLLVGPRAADAAAETRGRFDREIEATARLDHPNVLKLTDHGVDDATGAPYLVMPRMAGEDLGQLLARVTVLDPTAAIPLVLQACRGIAAGHRAGIVHRDIKPSNLFLEEEAGVILVKVSDFGLAKLQNAGIDSLTRSGAMLGTPQYMAPEQAQDAKRVDGRSDVYSLGMVLYHALSGSPAFKSSGAFMAFLLGHSSAPPLQKAAPWVDPEIARVVHAAVFRSPERRFPDLGEFELALVMAFGFDRSNTPVLRDSLATINDATKLDEKALGLPPEHWEDLLRR